MTHPPGCRCPVCSEKHYAEPSGAKLCSTADTGPLRVSFEVPESFDDGFKLMAVWQAAYKQFGLGLPPHERKAAKQWFDSWYDSQQVGR